MLFLDRGVLLKKVLLEISQIHRKTHMPVSLFDQNSFEIYKQGRRYISYKMKFLKRKKFTKIVKTQRGLSNIN